MCTLACYVNHTIILQCLWEDCIGFETDKPKNVYNISPCFIFLVKDMNVVAVISPGQLRVFNFVIQISTSSFITYVVTSLNI